MEKDFQLITAIVYGLLPIHYKQVLTYLELCNLKLGLLIDFNTLLMKDGINRIAHAL